MLPTWLGVAIAFVYGTIVGSFLNVCIYRLPEEKSVVNPPSHCPKCGTKLRGWDLVPLASFLALGRKCRYCGAPISWRYFVIELVTGLVFVATYLRYDYTIDFFAYVLLLSGLIVAFVVDLERLIIPDQVAIAAMVIGVGRDIAHVIAGDAHFIRIPTTPGGVQLPMLPSIGGMVVCAGLFYLVAYIGYFVFRPRGKEEDESEEYQGAMGGGDINLAAGIGAVLGIAPALVSFFVAVIVGSVVGVAYMIMKARAEKKGVPWRTEVPFGPFMVVGALAVTLLQPQLAGAWQAWTRLITG